jgi:hypothetical protein
MAGEFFFGTDCGDKHSVGIARTLRCTDAHMHMHTHTHTSASITYDHRPNLHLNPNQPRKQKAQLEMEMKTIDRIDGPGPHPAHNQVTPVPLPAHCITSGRHRPTTNGTQSHITHNVSHTQRQHKCQAEQETSTITVPRARASPSPSPRHAPSAASVPPLRAPSQHLPPLAQAVSQARAHAPLHRPASDERHVHCWSA